MVECCNTCRFKMKLIMYDYSKRGCLHTEMLGFVCVAMKYEGYADWMVGLNPQTGMCEFYEPKNRPDIKVSSFEGETMKH